MKTNQKRFLNSKNQGPLVSAQLPMELDLSNLPQHIAIIMDGNGRWAEKSRLNRIKGHSKGAATVKGIVTTCREIGVSVLTLYAFSTENWQRPKTEVLALMALLEKFLNSERKKLMDQDIRLNVIGQVERLPESVRKILGRTVSLTKNNKTMLLNLALSYGSRAEIVRMVKKVAADAVDGKIDPAEITEDTVSEHLYTKGIPDPDLLIRTSGEMRISNFLLWQIAYSEIYITKTLWPDFGRNELIDIIIDYQGRERRFGKV